VVLAPPRVHCVGASLASSLSLSQLTHRRRWKTEWRDRIFPAGARTPPWAQQHPNLFLFSAGSYHNLQRYTRTYAVHQGSSPTGRAHTTVTAETTSFSPLAHLHTERRLYIASYTHAPHRPLPYSPATKQLTTCTRPARAESHGTTPARPDALEQLTHACPLSTRLIKIKANIHPLILNCRRRSGCSSRRRCRHGRCYGLPSRRR
jgi:hypothetical protein